MRTYGKMLCLLLAAACLAAGLAGCRDTGEPVESRTPAPAPSPTATPAPAPAQFALACYPGASFHPVTGENRINLALGGLLYEGLFALDQRFQPQNVLCGSYAVSEDGLRWTFSLRAGPTFSDGSAVTAADVAACLNAARASVLYAARLSGISGVSAPEEGTVAVTLSAPNAALPALLDVPVYKGEGERPLGSGPYVLTGEGERLSLTARTGWWQGRDLPRQAIPLRAIQEADGLIHAFDTRDVSLVSTDLNGTNSLGFSGSYETVDYPTSAMLYVGFNTASGVCADRTVRQALQRCFDRESVATLALSRHARASALPVSPASPLHAQDLDEALSYDPQQGQALLAAAGWERGKGAYQNNGRELTLRLLVSSDNGDKLAVAQLLADNLDQAGFGVELVRLTWEDYLTALEQGDFDLYLGEVRLTGDFDLSALISAGGGVNYGGYADAQAAGLLSAFRAASGQARSLAARALYQHLSLEPPFAVLCFKSWSVLTQWRQVSALTPTQQNVFYGFADWNIT